MIFWKDFILDDQFGPQLFVAEGEPGEWLIGGDMLGAGECHGTRSELGNSVMEDARKSTTNLSIQETGQEERPARMVGLSGLESHSTAVRARSGRDAKTSISSASRGSFPLIQRRKPTPGAT